MEFETRNRDHPHENAKRSKEKTIVIGISLEVKGIFV